MKQSIVFIPSNNLTFQSVELERKRLLADIQSHSHMIVYIDLQNVASFDSAGLAFLLEAKRLCAASNNILMMQGMSSNMMDLSEFCGLKSILVTN